MSKAKENQKARKREAFWGKRGVGKNGSPRRPCPNCGEYGAHYMPASLGDPGQYICVPFRGGATI